jgi:hypothetical protein
MRTLLTLAAVLLLGAGIVTASSVEALSDAELVKRSRCVVHGSVTRVSTEWDTTGTRVFTLVELVPHEILKGDVAPVVTLKLPGGTKGGTTTLIHGMPVFQEGEEVVVFLSLAHAKLGTSVPVGLGQGKWTVERGASGARARRSLAGVRLVPPPGSPPPSLPSELGLTDLLSALRTEIARQKSAGGR